MTIWKTKSKIYRPNHFIEDFSMLIKQYYCIVRKVEKKTESKNQKVVKTKNGRIMLLSKCEACDNKKFELIKKQETSGFLSSLGIKTTWSKMTLVGPLLF